MHFLQIVSKVYIVIKSVGVDGYCIIIHAGLGVMYNTSGVLYNRP